MRSRVFSHFQQAVLKPNGWRSGAIILRQLPCVSYPAQVNARQIRHYHKIRKNPSVAVPTLRDPLLPGNLVQSPLSDVELPENTALHEIIFEKCDKFKDLLAVSDFATGRSYTYSQLKDKAMRVASALCRQGYKKGDVILVISTNHIDFTVTQLAASSLGCWFSGANPSYTPVELARQISHGECKAIFVLDSLVEVVKEALIQKEFPNQVQDMFVYGESPGLTSFDTLMKDDGSAFPEVTFDTKEDVCVLPYSSGTTGFPKGVMASHHNIVSNIIQIDHHNTQKVKDSVLGLLPLFHGFGTALHSVATFFNGGHIHNLTHFEPQSFLQCLQDKEINNASLVPPLVLFLTKSPLVDDYDLSKLSRVLSAAAPLGKELTDGFLKRFPHVRLLQGYGLTEACPGISLDKEQNIGSVGHVLPNTLVKILDLDTGEQLGPNQQGELCAKGPQMMKGYFKNPEATKEMIREDGWMHTGDVAYYDENGLLYICDRLKELIKVKGYQVAPAELEAILIGHPDIADACVIGVPDEVYGEVPKAFVVKSPGSDVTKKTVVEFIEGQVSKSKRLLGGVEFIQEIPKNPSGKILRRLLRKPQA